MIPQLNEYQKHILYEYTASEDHTVGNSVCETSDSDSESKFYYSYV